MLLDIERDEAIVHQIDDRIEALVANVEGTVVVDLIVLYLVVESEIAKRQIETQATTLSGMLTYI